jgi:hypothetical protein
MRLLISIWMGKHDRFFNRHRFPCWFLISLILISMTGCLPLDLAALTPTNPPVPARTQVALPATWTKPPPTATSTASLTPTPTTIPTITPTTTATPSLAPSIVPTEVSLEPDPTIDWTAISLPACTFTATEPGVRIHPAPFIDPYHILPTMEPGKAYPAVLTKPTYTLLLDGRQPLGWVDYRLLALTSEGGDCLTEYDEREVWDFPLCFFTPLEEINGYSDAAFTNPMHTLSPPASFVVLNQSESYYFTAYGSSGPSFVVKKEEVFTHGNCDDIPTLAKATIETALYSDLPSQGGSVVYTLEVDESIYTQSQSKNGAPPPGVVGSGIWILARRPSWSEDINGWVWSGHIEKK